MKTPQIVIDTNVIVAAFHSQHGASYKLLSLLLKGKLCQMNVSSALILEYEEVLKREEILIKLNESEIDELIDIICVLAKRHSLRHFDWRPISKDPDDDFLANLAINAKADAIITFNKSDFKALSKFG